MPRFEFEQPADTQDWVDRSTRMLNLAVRGIGLLVLLVGVFFALVVISTAWTLYREPASIEPFAQAIEAGSNLDLTVSSAAHAGRRQLDEPADPSVTGGGESVSQPVFRFSYFAAWLLAILLLMLVGRLAISAIKTGGELALYDVQVKKLARALLEERARGNDPSSRNG